MSGIIWNVRGFGNLATQRRALFLRRHHHLSFLAVLEPMVDLDCRYMARRMGFEEVVSNKSGKVWFFWDSTIACKVLFDHDQFLHLELSSQLFPSSMIVTVVYAKCTRLERSLLWESLEELRPEGDRLWLVGGDFNVISSMEEHSAGVLARPGAMEDFNNFIMLAGLVDVFGDHLSSGACITCPHLWSSCDSVAEGLLRFQRMGCGMWTLAQMQRRSIGVYLVWHVDRRGLHEAGGQGASGVLDMEEDFKDPFDGWERGEEYKVLSLQEEVA
ncbi:hypothetical protein ZIOFF_075556 [Zingiber officinale]|uniref:Endonuclease/exonuclease/phosphatase domain-containing protein n=1 Tax=Zingiber officinale TaxID=94328 RepID=A0A8J5C4T1_ZINOF|nr:hypothetical protein ZIOFF_075556 [Zingiber officinale]